MQELCAQHEALSKIERVAAPMKAKSVKDKKGFVQENIKAGDLGEIQFPLDPSTAVYEVECKKVFDSAQKPIWFQFKNR